MKSERPPAGGHRRNQVGGFLLPLILIIIAFVAGVYVGHRYYGKLIEWLSKSAKKPVETLSGANENASGSVAVRFARILDEVR
jgi:hypothetical protein